MSDDVFYYQRVNRIVAIVVVVVQCSCRYVLQQILAIENALALNDDNKAKTHLYPKIIFLIYRATYYKKQTMPGSMDQVTRYR
jgi:hypothetical protein